MDEWLGRPSVGRQPDLCSRESTGKRVRVRREYEAKKIILIQIRKIDNDNNIRTGASIEMVSEQ